MTQDNNTNPESHGVTAEEADKIMYCDHKSWSLLSHGSGSGPDLCEEHNVSVCKACGEIKVTGFQGSPKHYFEHVFCIHMPYAVDAILKQALVLNENEIERFTFIDNLRKNYASLVSAEKDKELAEKDVRLKFYEDSLDLLRTYCDENKFGKKGENIFGRVFDGFMEKDKAIREYYDEVIRLNEKNEELIETHRQENEASIKKLLDQQDEINRLREALEYAHNKLYTLTRSSAVFRSTTFSIDAHKAYDRVHEALAAYKEKPDNQKEGGSNGTTN